MTTSEHCGYIAIIGRPNVGKSTLLNRILGQKLSITSRRPQTTRHRILGIKTEAGKQAIYVDTPGMHRQSRKAMNRYLNKAATTALYDVNMVIMVVSAEQWTEEDADVLKSLQQALGQKKIPVILALNKVDRIDNKDQLLPTIQTRSKQFPFAHIIPVSALKGHNIEGLEAQVMALLPAEPFLFPKDQLTDRSERFIVAERVREKLTRRLGKELPYALTVVIEEFKNKEGVLHISAIIWVARASQKRIVVGKGGKVLKEVGQQAREEMECLLEHKIFLRLWVKVREGWSDNERCLQEFGYTE